jgi:tetratricopeptide (TPR) repeat protein
MQRSGLRDGTEEDKMGEAHRGGSYASGRVFISYRREGGAETARLVRDALKERGYTVFLDVEELRSGPFNEALFGEIEASTDMVVVLAKDSLGRCSERNDWLRLEVSYAIKRKKNIVPIMLRDFEWPKEPLHESLKGLPLYNGIAASHEYFDASMDRLATLLTGMPRRPSHRAALTKGFLAVAVLAAAAITITVRLSGPGKAPAPSAPPLAANVDTTASIANASSTSAAQPRNEPLQPEPAVVKRENTQKVLDEGMTLKAKGESDSAIQRLRTVLTGLEGAPGTERQRASCHVSIGDALLNLKRPEEDITEQRKALELYSKLAGCEFEKAGCHRNIAAVLSDLGRHEESAAEVKQALDMYAKLSGTERAQANGHENIGRELGYQGRYEETIAEMRRALDIYTKLPGTDSEQAACHGAIGLTLNNCLRRYEEAIAERRQELALLSKLPNTEAAQANCHLNIADPLGSLARSEEALAEYREGLAIYSKMPGREREQAGCHRYIALLLQSNLMRYEEAIAEHRKALEIYSKLPGTDGEQATCRMNIDVLMKMLGKDEKATEKHL